MPIIRMVVLPAMVVASRFNFPGVVPFVTAVRLLFQGVAALFVSLAKN